VRAQSITSYCSSVNDAAAAISYGYQAIFFTQEARQPVVGFCMIAITALYLIGAGRLHEAEQLIQQALLLQTPSDAPHYSEVGWVMIMQAEILRERNQ